MANNIHLSNSIPANLIPGYTQIVGLGYNAFPKMYTKLFNVKQSTKQFERQTLMSTLGVAQAVEEMAAIPLDSFGQRYTVEYLHRKIGLGIAMSNEFKEDQQNNFVDATKVQQLGESIAKAKEIDHADILVDGFSGGATGGDGKQLFATDHVSGVGTYSNRLASDAPLSETSLEQMIIEMAAMTDEKGNKMDLKAKDLWVASANQFNAHRILNSIQRTGTPDNDPNAIKELGLIKSVNVWAYLDDAPNAWYLTTDVKDGLTSFSRREVEVSIEDDKGHDAVYVYALCRYSNGWTDPRGIVGTTGV
jgi:hypothetical protein